MKPSRSGERAKVHGSYIALGGLDLARYAC